MLSGKLKPLECKKVWHTFSIGITVIGPKNLKDYYHYSKFIFNK